MEKIFVTGSNGFVGSALTKMLNLKKLDYTSGNRNLYGDISNQHDWLHLLKGHSSVVHLAARVHIMEEKEDNPLALFLKYNSEATLDIAKAAKQAGVKKFIYISTIKVNGEETFEIPFTANDLPNPSDPYGVSKFEAEKLLMQIHEPNIFEVVIIRPPLIYGPGVKANFQKLQCLVGKGIPLPFGGVKNKRAMVSVLNLCDLIINCLNNPKASGEVFLVSDDHSYSLREMLQLIGRSMNISARLIYIPSSIIKFLATMAGKKALATRLLGNLEVDITKTKEVLKWSPPYSFIDTFKK